MFATPIVNGVGIVRFHRNLLRIVITGVRITSFCCVLLWNLSLLGRDLDKSVHSGEVVAGLWCLVGVMGKRNRRGFLGS
ncbi:hypothetical protein TIFTF001_009126 [Ficus carica]|uniref:Uncharacterized protein n=1 Tax=Ficus carica TaxID=3494 RepID=A0AA88CYN6_FICCA|nr:hypothetical protein TIFTF001_009126 [Ficus carica]